MEDTLIRDGTFSLPGRKAPLKSDAEYEVILVGATESPIERLQKKTILFRKEKAAHLFLVQDPGGFDACLQSTIKDIALRNGPEAFAIFGKV